MMQSPPPSKDRQDRNKQHGGQGQGQGGAGGGSTSGLLPNRYSKGGHGGQGGVPLGGAAHDMWALGCVLSELLTETFVSQRARDHHIHFFWQSKACMLEMEEEMCSAHPDLALVAKQLLVHHRDRRMTAAKLKAVLGEY